jgi:hypothetical protein
MTRWVPHLAMALILTPQRRLGISGPNDTGELDPQSLVAQSIGVLIGSPESIAGKFCG